jgi:heterotetrameric sarcosine oxidase gamma subunit
MVEPATPAWRPISAWAGIDLLQIGLPQIQTTDGAGIRIALRDERGQANLIVSSGKRAAFTAAAATAYGAVLEDRRACRGTCRGTLQGLDVTFLWSGPDHWTVIAADPHIVADLGRHFVGLAAVIDQTSSRAVVRIGGAKARDVLAKGVLIDLHPRAFQPGDVALTSIAHIGALLWQVDDAPTYEISISRSLAESFWHWLALSAALFGVAIDGPSAMPG